MREFSIGFITTGLLIEFIEKPTIWFGLAFILSLYLSYDILIKKHEK